MALLAVPAEAQLVLVEVALGASEVAATVAVVADAELPARADESRA